MFKKIYILFFLLFLSSCAAPGTALISPVITGAKTKSAHQASLSLASSISSKKIFYDFKSTYNISLDTLKDINFLNAKNTILPSPPYIEENPKILLTYVVDNIEISEVYEPEPLP